METKYHKILKIISLQSENVSKQNLGVCLTHKSKAFTWSRKRRVCSKAYARGFVFSAEAVISLLLFSAMLFALPQPNTFSYKELALLQQENDLLRVWSSTGLNETEMTKDAQKIFSNNAEVWINERKILSCEKKTNSISAEGVILDLLLQEKTVKVVVYYN